MFRPFITVLLLASVVSTAESQELATADQLLQQAAARPEAVASYIAGWRDATMAGLLQTAAILQEATGENGETAKLMSARAMCIGNLGVADLALQLREMDKAGSISTQEPSAISALYDIATELCRMSVEEALAVNR